MLVPETCLCMDDVDPGARETLVPLVLGDLRNDPSSAPHDRREVESRRRNNDPLFLRLPGLVRHLRDLDQRLRGNAAVEGAVAADPRLLLDERHGDAELASGQRGR
jgi:hypothetical protein